MTLDDQAESMEQLDRDVCMKYRKPELVRIGFCHNCSEPINDGVFCSPECREDAEQRERFNR
jgi:hypothetical protein